MKKLLLSVCFGLLATFLFSTIPATEKHALLEHLIEVNVEWVKQDLSNDLLLQAIDFQSDNQRIQKHLALVETSLRNKNVAHLSSTQKSNRIKQLNVLRQYWQAGQFPKNTFHSFRIPYFVDVFGTACAVGYLVFESGEQDLVERISKENNFAYLAEMEYPELGIWAEKNGFTLEELAWIQPSYPPDPYNYSTVGNNEGIEGIVNVIKATPDDSLLIFAGKFSSIDGVAANNIIAFDGEEWITLGDGVDGEVLDITFDRDQNLIVAGDFEIDNYHNLSRWNFKEARWEWLDIIDMDGPIHAVTFKRGILYVGGEFSDIDGKSFQNLAFNYLYTNTHQGWNNWKKIYIGFGNYEYIQHAFGVDGPVRAFDWNNDNLLVGGDFSLTAPNVEDPDEVQQLNANHLAYWNETDWVHSLNGDHSPVTNMKLKNGALFIGGDFQDDLPSLAILTGGLWSDFGVWGIWGSDGGVYDFADYGENVVMMGNYSFTFGFYFSRNMMIFNSDGSIAKHAIVDGTVWAGASFKDQFYFAGDFTRAAETEVNGLASTKFENYIVDPEPPGEGGAKVYAADNQLVVYDYQSDYDGTLELFNLQGQLVATYNLPAGQFYFNFPVKAAYLGAYVYRLENKEERQIGKVVF